MAMSNLVEISIGKWSLPCGSSSVDHVVFQIKLGEVKEMSIAECGVTTVRSTKISVGAVVEDAES